MNNHRVVDWNKLTAAEREQLRSQVAAGGEDLRGSTFFGADLKGWTFFRCDLSHVDFKGADCRGTHFLTCDLNSINWSRTTFDGTTDFAGSRPARQ
jgi:uncharacterized protein YjbI with pentapeptide repeats